MRYLFFIALLLILNLGISQYAIIPTSIFNQVKNNVVYHGGTSLHVGQDVSTIYFHSDLYTLYYNHVKISADYIHQNNFYDINNVDQYRIKANFSRRFSRKYSLVASASVGTYVTNRYDFIYSGGIALFSQRAVLGYHLYDNGESSLNTVNFKYFFYLKNASNKYDQIILNANYNIGEMISYVVNPDFLNIGFNSAKMRFTAGAYRSENNIQPMFGVGTNDLFNSRTIINVNLNLFLKTKEIPDFQINLNYLLHNKRGKSSFRYIPGPQDY